MSQPILPDELLIKILTCCSPNTVASTRIVSKRLNSLVNYNYLWRPAVDEFSVELRQYEDRSAPLGRIQFKKTQKIKKRLVVTVKKNNRTNAIIEECEEGPSKMDTSKIGEAMRSIKLSERLSFDGVVADSTFYKMLTSKWNDMSEVKMLSFMMAKLRLSEEQMVQILSKTCVNNLTLDFCHHETDTLTDKVVAAMPKLQSLRVQVRAPLMFYSLTDKTLKAWISNPPSTVNLGRITTGFTLQGISEVIQELKSTTVDWDLGTILQFNETAIEMLKLSKISGVQIKINDDFRSKRYEVCGYPSPNNLHPMKIAFNLTES